MQRVWALVERELRRFRRSPMLMIVSMVFPMVQLVVLGYAFGGAVKHLKLGVVDQDKGVPAVKLRELFGAVMANADTFETVNYSDPGEAMIDLRNGRINGVLTIPPEFSRRTFAKNEPHIALIADNTDNIVTGTMVATLSNLVAAYNAPPIAERVPPKARHPGGIC